MNQRAIKVILLCLLILAIGCQTSKRITISNLKPRVDSDGQIIDAHDGRIVRYGDRFYWYGTAYGDTTGFLNFNYFRCYSSLDLMHWENEGVILEDRPDGAYYRPHVIYHEQLEKYILWFNWYPTLWDGKLGVAISDNPQGPFDMVNDDVKFVHSDLGLGDFSLFVDDDKQAYLAYNTIEGHQLSIEKLTEDYLSSTMENGGIVTQGCEAGAIFKRNGQYYMLTDYTCCFCTQGSGVRVYTSDSPLGKWTFQNNINRYPGTHAPALVDQEKSPNLYQTILKQQDSQFSPIQIDFSKQSKIDQLCIYQFTGNREGIDCGDQVSKKMHDESVIEEFQVWIKEGNTWRSITAKTQVEKTAIYHQITLTFNDVTTQSLLIKPASDYPYDRLYINEIEVLNHGHSLPDNDVTLRAYVNDRAADRTDPIIPAQQTFVMPLQTRKGLEYLWMGDLWGSASDNIKGHDYQYWGPPLQFDDAGHIKTLHWVDEWEIDLAK